MEKYDINLNNEKDVMRIDITLNDEYEYSVKDGKLTVKRKIELPTNINSIWEEEIASSKKGTLFIFRQLLHAMEYYNEKLEYDKEQVTGNIVGWAILINTQSEPNVTNVYEPNHVFVFPTKEVAQHFLKSFESQLKICRKYIA